MASNFIKTCKYRHACRLRSFTVYCRCIIFWSCDQLYFEHFTNISQVERMRLTLRDGAYVKLEIEGKLRQASFCSVGSYDSEIGDEGFCDATARKESILSSQSSTPGSADQLIKEKRKRSLKSFRKSLTKKTRSFGSIFVGFFRLRGIFRRIKKTHQHNHRREEEEEFLCE